MPSDKGLDRPAFAHLYEQRADDLLVFFTRRTLDPEIARDLWAETFAQAFAARRRFRGQSSEQAVSWLYGIAYRQLGITGAGRPSAAPSIASGYSNPSSARRTSSGSSRLPISTRCEVASPRR